MASRESVEGYENGNWPATTGNRSGGGRGNAAPDDDWGDDDDTVSSGPDVLASRYAARARTEYLLDQPPEIPNRWRQQEIEGIVTHWVDDHSGGFRFSLEPDPKANLPEDKVFKIHERLVTHFCRLKRIEVLKRTLHGDRVRFITGGQLGEVYRFKNLSWDPDRLKLDLTDFWIEHRDRMSR